MRRTRDRAARSARARGKSGSSGSGASRARRRRRARRASQRWRDVVERERLALAPARRFHASSSATAGGIDRHRRPRRSTTPDRRQRQRDARREHAGHVVDRQRARERPAAVVVGSTARPVPSAAAARSRHFGAAPLFLSASVLIRPSTPRALDRVVELVAVVGDQAHAGDDDVVGLPAVRRLRPCCSRSGPAPARAARTAVRTMTSVSPGFMRSGL